MPAVSDISASLSSSLTAFVDYLRNDNNKKTLLAGCAAAAAAATVAAGSLAYFYRLPPARSVLGWSHLVFGHRGCREIVGYPENTIAAFQYAVDRGAQGIEYDVRLTKDGVLVSHHDDTTTPLLVDDKGPRRIVDLTLEELRQLHYRDDPSKTVRIATAKEVLLWAKQQQIASNVAAAADNKTAAAAAATAQQPCKVLLEYKATAGVSVQDGVKKVLELFQEEEAAGGVGPAWMLEHCMVICFDPRVLYALRALEPQIHTCMLMRRDWLVVTGQHKALPLPLRLFPTACDLALWITVSRFAPWLINCRCVGPKHDHFDESTTRAWRATHLVYFWGYRVAEHGTQWKKWMWDADGVAAACDDDYNHLKTCK